MEKALYDLMNDVQVGVIPSIFNQALMELGATVCLPNGAPRCEACPWYEICEARKQDRIAELPVKTKAKERRIEKRTVLIIKDGSQLALHKRPKKGLLAGMYELPNVDGYLSETEVTSYVKGQGYLPVRVQKACEAKHIFSHVEWHMIGYVVFLQAKEFLGEDEPAELQMQNDWIFVDVEETERNYAIPSAFVKYAEYLNLTIGKEAVEKRI
jgi:A/G-specific adenine glycosylase